MTTTALLLVGFGYLVGSIPFAFLVARRLAGVDVRVVGSGNVGTTNVLRAAGAWLAVVTALLDVGKGALVVLVARRAGADAAGAVMTGLAAIVGHVWPVWLHFRGGKGVATTCGVFVVLSPVAAAAAVAVFVVTVWGTRYVSLGSVIATALLPLLVYAAHDAPEAIIGAVVAAAVVIYQHRSNLARLQAGTERRLSPKVH